MKMTLTLTISLMVGLSTSTQASIVGGYGVQASAGTASNCPSYCSGDFQSDINGGEFATSASSSENSYGSASATAVYTGSSTYLPTLKVNASSGLGKRASANAFGVQGYSYNGTETSITLDFNLHGSVGNNASGYTSSYVSASIAVVASSSLEWYPDFGTLVYEIASLIPGNEVVGNKFVSINDGLDQNSSGSITFDVFDGMDFYVVASMNASANNGFADASHTFTMEFDNDSGLTAAQVSAVPVPAAVWLFGSGLVGLVGLARRRTAI